MAVVPDVVSCGKDGGVGRQTAASECRARRIADVSEFHVMWYGWQHVR